MLSRLKPLSNNLRKLSKAILLQTQQSRLLKPLFQQRRLRASVVKRFISKRVLLVTVQMGMVFLVFSQQLRAVL